MKGLKALRTARNLTQGELASQLGTTQQTVARWESGQAEPPLATLRDIAMRFGTSVDALLDHKTPRRTTTYCLLSGEDDGFWGHIGLLAPGAEKTRWYPITMSDAERISRSLAEDDDPDAWLVVDTLANRTLAFRPTALKRVWLLDDACDGPPNDFENHLPFSEYEGLPHELYQAMADWVLHAHGDSEDWKDNNSRELRAEALRRLRSAGLHDDPERAMEALLHTNIRFIDGSETRYEVEPEALFELTYAIDLEIVAPAMVALPRSGGSFHSWFATSQVALIEIPTIELAKERAKIDAELEGLMDEVPPDTETKVDNLEQPIPKGKNGPTIQ